MTRIDWKEAANLGFVLVDFPARKVAVFANQSGRIVIATEVDGEASFVDVEVDEAVRLVALVRDAIDDAVPVARKFDAEYAAFNAIENARHGKVS